MKPSSNMTVPAFLLPALLKTGLDFDVDTIAVLKKHGIDLQTLNMDSDRIPADSFQAVMDELVELTQNPAIAINYSHHFAYDYIPEMESFLLSASTLRETLMAYRWMGSLFDSLITATTYTKDKLFTVQLNIMPGTPSWVGRLYAECSFALVARLIFQKSGNNLRLRRIGFTHNDKQAVPVYQNAFRCPISLGEEHNFISFAEEDVDKALEHHSPALKTLSRFQVEQRIARLNGKKTLPESLTTMLKQHPYLMANGIEECASRMYMTPRTLQRKLKNQGTSFREILEGVRHQLAKQYLADHMPIESISDLLCFSDRRSFTRAFRKWEGALPSDYRKRAAH